MFYLKIFGYKIAVGLNADSYVSFGYYGGIN